MNEKLKYAPGKPGFGSKGEKGTDGQQGLSMYFTDYEGIIAGDYRIKTRIIANTDLWSASPPAGGMPLPDGRVYVTGDLFIDNEGKVYEINVDSTDKFVYTYANLNLGGFFTPLGASSSEGYQRYFNSNVGQKYIIDNVHTSSGAIDYTNSPVDIYGIDPLNFTRVEFTDIKQTGNLNAFTTYTINSTDDKDALAIVYNEASSNFHIGNKDSGGNVRNTNLIFDVSNLIVYKDGTNDITVNSPPGTVLTNYEINANSIFDNNFDDSPVSFTSVSGINDCSISWNISDFGSGDTNLKAELVFYEKLLNINGTTFRTDSSAARPLVFSNLDASGSIKINGLKTTSVQPYEYYMKLIKNGWSRISAYGTIFAGTLNVLPNPKVLDSSNAYGTGTIEFAVTSNIGWYAPTFVSNPSSFLTLDFVSPWSGYDGSIRFSATSNPGRTRTGVFRVTPYAGLPKDVSITQPGAIIDVDVSTTIPVPEFTTGSGIGVPKKTQDSVNIYVNNLPAASMVDIRLDLLFNVYNHPANPITLDGQGSFTVRDKNNVLLTSMTKTWPSQEGYTTPVAWNGEFHTPSGTPVQSVYYACSSANLPLKVTYYAQGEYGSVPGGGYSYVSLEVRNIQVTKAAGPEIYVHQAGYSGSAYVSMNI